MPYFVMVILSSQKINCILDTMTQKCPMIFPQKEVYPLFDKINLKFLILKLHSFGYSKKIQKKIIIVTILSDPVS